MFLRDAPTETLTTIKDRLDQKFDAISITGTDISIDFENRMIRIGKREIDMTLDSMVILGEFVDVPTPWVKKADTDIVAHVLNMTYQRTHNPLVAKVSPDTGLITLREPNAKSIEARHVIDVAAKVLSPTAPVIDFVNTTKELGLDVVVTDRARHGIGGDPSAKVDVGGKKVGDITKAGLRFGQNVKQNLVPWVQPYTYRLVCTNGMEIPDKTLKIEGRGNTVEEVLAELEAAAERAFSRVERDIEHFYAMREERVDNPERQINRMALEHDLSDRMRTRLVDTVPAYADEHGMVSMFDLVNMVTNLANDPQISNRGHQRNFQRFGGSIVSTHVERCRSCSSSLTKL